jgi:signal transduction histidine kinase
VKLRSRFTFTLALAALVPISVAAVVTRQIYAKSFREKDALKRQEAKNSIETTIDRLKISVQKPTEALASPTHKLTGAIMENISNTTLVEQLRQHRDDAVPTMTGFGLDTLTITGLFHPKNQAPKFETVLVAPHWQGHQGDQEPELRKIAETTKGNAYFAFERMSGLGDDAPPTLIIRSTKIATNLAGTISVTVSAGRRIGDEAIGGIHDELTETRVVTADGSKVLVPPKKDWAKFTKEPVIPIHLLGADGHPIARIEIGVSDGDLESGLQLITYSLAGLALGALAIVILLGLLVGRRTARDLDALVIGSLAASRGDLDHRVPVRSNDEIGAVASAFNFMMEDLRMSKERLVIAERIAAWQDIARRLAHEIKNPLTPIQMAMDTLRKTWKKQHPSFDEILEESTTTVLQEADRLKHIVTEFSDFARMPKPDFQRLDVNDVVRSALTLYQGAVPLETKLAPVLPHVDADKGQINQVVINLVENARDAIGKRPDGKIFVSTKLGEAGDRAMIIVEDNGPGVPSDLKDKVFAPYFTTKHAKGGTGLGLAIVHRIVSDHGGRIAVSDAAGGGARFIIELPLRNGTALLASRI